VHVQADRVLKLHRNLLGKNRAHGTTLWTLPSLPTDTVQRVYGSVCWQMRARKTEIRDFSEDIIERKKTSVLTLSSKKW
jgi:hypothetical protein